MNDVEQLLVVPEPGPVPVEDPDVPPVEEEAGIVELLLHHFAGKAPQFPPLSIPLQSERRLGHRTQVPVEQCHKSPHGGRRLPLGDAECGPLLGRLPPPALPVRYGDGGEVVPRQRQDIGRVVRTLAAASAAAATAEDGTQRSDVGGVEPRGRRQRYHRGVGPVGKGPAIFDERIVQVGRVPLGRVDAQLGDGGCGPDRVVEEDGWDAADVFGILKEVGLGGRRQAVVPPIDVLSERALLSPPGFDFDGGSIICLTRRLAAVFAPRLVGY
mmetsp:Transcript_46466/g.129308  ORF Transcript_46466/g.129308 Transcript_46466/m.129308 type:complete len:270 (-) Transcript_46466:418-1227(-)